LQSVKDEIRHLIQLQVTNQLREDEGKSPLPVYLNRVFIGNPGTGKTTVAKLYAQILKDLGLLSNGQVIEKAVSNFIGRYVGESEANTLAILKSAVGNVLVIDEAYGFYAESGDQFKQCAVNTIVENIHGTPGEDICVILLGYKDKMDELFSKSNPGLRSRFMKTFIFEDYSDDELYEILQRELQKHSMTISAEDAWRVVRKFSLQRNNPLFGNARSFLHIISAACAKCQAASTGAVTHLRYDEFDL